MLCVPPPGNAAATRYPFGPTPARLRLWVMSDLRVDKRPLTLAIEPRAFDVVVVAGNVSDGLEKSLIWLGETFEGCRRSHAIVFVPGNREFWDGAPRGEALRRGRLLARELGVHLLSDESVRIEDSAGRGIHFVGSTLWTDWCLNGRGRATLARGYARHGHRDCRRIRLGQSPHLPHDAAGSHARSRAYIEDCLGTIKVASEGFGSSANALVRTARPGDRAIVVTHHAPSRLSVPSFSSPEVCDEWIAASQASDLEDVMLSWGAPALWIHGHVLARVDYAVGRTRVLANPRGETEGVSDPSFFVEV